LASENGTPPTKPARRRSEWRERTAAEVCSPVAFADRKAAGGWHVAGVLGFAGRWERSGRTGDDLDRFIADARHALTAELVRCRDAHRDRLLVCTGATHTGVLQLTYEICTTLGCKTLSVAPDRALNYELGPLDFVIPLGEAFGDESEWFVHVCDEFILLGGGKQSHREILLAAAQGKAITVIQGLGGVADELTVADLPTARFV
jgi:hypothetical protein